MTSPLEQKKRKINGTVVVTANRLGDGAVVYRTIDGNWTTDLSSAAVVDNALAAAEILRAAEADGVRAVGPYVAPVDLSSDRRVLPGNLRERIRVGGPTIAFAGRPEPTRFRDNGSDNARHQLSQRASLAARIRGDERLAS